MQKLLPKLLLALIVAPIVVPSSHCCAEIALEFRDDVTGTFLDISGTGNAVTLSDDGETTRFSTFLGQSFRIGNNGGVALASSGSLHYRNRTLPSSRVFGGNVEAFLPFWDDLDSESGNVFWQDMGDRLIVQWDDRNHYPGNFANSGITFQAQIFSNRADTQAGDVVAQFLYDDTQFASNQSFWNNGSSATVGYQGLNESLMWSYNQAVITNGSVITLQAVVPEPSTLSMAGIAGVLVATRRRRR